MKALSQTNNLLNFLKKLRLKSIYFHIFTYIITLVKLLPLFIITHDWNIVHTNGISHYFIELTLGPILYRINNLTFSVVLLVLMLLLSLVPFIYLLVYYCKLKRYDVFLFSSKNTFKVCVWLLYIIPFLLNQYIFTICVFNFFMKKHHPKTNDYFCFIIIIIQIIFIGYCLIISFFLSILSIGPFYTTSKILVSTIGNVEFKWICFAICQGIIEMEYYLEFKTMVYIKCVIRGLYILYYLTFLFNLPKEFMSNFLLRNIIMNMCFFSCFIEFCAMYTFKDDLKLLSSNTLFIFLKLILEIILAIILNIIIKSKDEKYLLDFFAIDNENVNIGTSVKNLGFPLFSKFLLKYSGLVFDKTNTKLTLNLINRFQSFFIIHKENCHHKRDCYCKKHKVDEIKINFDKFHYVNESNPKKIIYSFKEFCPALFSYIDNFLQTEINKVSAYNNGELILLLILFHMECNKNFTMAYYFIDKYVHTSQYKNSFVIRIQTELIKAKLKYYNKELIKQSKLGIGRNQEENFSLLNQENSKLQLKNIVCFMKIEKEIQNSFNLYYEFLVKTTLSDDSTESFERDTKSISNQLKLCKDTIIYYVNSYYLTNNEKCLSFQICSKLSLYFKFFYGKIPPKLKVYFQPLTTFYNLSKFQINDNVLLIRLSNTKNVVMHIEYISDSLLVELGFSTHIDLKLDTLNDVISQKHSNIYERYLVDQVLKGEHTIKIPYILFRDKFNFLRLYHFHANVIITDKFVSMHCNLKNVNKSNHCFIVLNNTGNIIGMSQEFNETFYLNMNLINKLQLIFFNDLLGLNFDEQNLNKTLNIETIKFFENINLLSANLIFENNQEEYAQIYQHAREAIAKIKKSPLASLVKTLEIHLIPFSLTKDTSNDLFFIAYFTIINKSNVNLLHQVLSDKSAHDNHKMQNMNWRSSKDILTQKIESGLITPTPEAFRGKGKEIDFQNMMELSKDRGDIMEKLNLIREFGFATLHFVFGIKHQILDEVSLLYKKSHTNNDEPNNDNGSINKKRVRNMTKNKLFFQMKLFIFIFSFFFCFTIFVEIYSNSLYNNIYIIVDTQVYLIIAKKIINALATATIGMVLIQNGIQNGTIDYGFNYDYQADIVLLQGRIEDYLENFKKFRDNYYSNTFQSFPDLDLIQTYLLTNIDFESMDINYNQITEEQTLYEIFNYLHIRLKTLIDIEINPLYFNNTNGNFKCTECKTDNNNKTEDSTNLASDVVSVFILRNFLTKMNYPLIEIINFCQELISLNINKATMFILFMNILNSLLILLLLIYQLIVYYNLSTELFVKWFLNVCFLRYFSLALVQKTKLLKGTIDIATIDSVTHLTMTKLKIANAKEENYVIQEVTKLIDEEFQFHITPFHVITEVKEFEFSMNLRTNFIRQTNSEFMIESNFLKPPTLKRQLTQTQEDDKTKSHSAQFHRKMNSVNKKKLSKTNLPNANISSINNITSDNLIHKSLNQMNAQPTSGSGLKEKRMGMSVHHSGRIVLILIFIVLAALISFGHFIFSKMLFNLLQNFSYYQSITLLRSNYFHEVLLCYQMIVLNNAPLYFEYKSGGYLNHSKQSYYLNSFEVHDVFNETLARYNLLSDIFETIVTDISSSAFQKTLIKFEMKLRQTGACEDIVLFLDENKSVLNLKLFVSLNNQDSESLIKRCQLIGGGYNRKGIRTAFSSLVNYVTDNYRDFIAKGNNRDNEYNYNIFQEPTIQTYQVETNRMLELLFFNYQIAIVIDYNNRYKTLKLLNTIYLIGVIFILIILCWIYLDKFTTYYVKMDDSIEKVKNIVISTIIY